MRLSVLVRAEEGTTRAEACLELPLEVEMAFAPLETTDLTPLGSGETLRGSAAHERVVRFRKGTADRIAAALSRSLMDAMAKHDRHNGYRIAGND